MRTFGAACPPQAWDGARDPHLPSINLVGADASLGARSLRVELVSRLPVAATPPSRWACVAWIAAASPHRRAASARTRDDRDRSASSSYDPQRSIATVARDGDEPSFFVRPLRSARPGSVSNTCRKPSPRMPASRRGFAVSGPPSVFCSAPALTRARSANLRSAAR